MLNLKFSSGLIAFEIVTDPNTFHASCVVFLQNTVPFKVEYSSINIACTYYKYYFIMCIMYIHIYVHMYYSQLVMSTMMWRLNGTLRAVFK